MVLLFLPRLASSSSAVDRPLPLQTHDHSGLFSTLWNLGDISLGAWRNVIESITDCLRLVIGSDHFILFVHIRKCFSGAFSEGVRFYPWSCFDW